MNRQRCLPLYQGEITEANVYHAYALNTSVNSTTTWDEVLRSPALFYCLALEARYTHKGQMPRKYSPIRTEETAMPKHTAVLDAAQINQIKLALALCRERIACPASTTVETEEAVRELKAAQDIFRAHEDRQQQLQGGTHV